MTNSYQKKITHVLFVFSVVLGVFGRGTSAYAALHLITGFETGDTSECSSTTGSPSVTTSAVRTGTYGLRIDADAEGCNAVAGTAANTTDAVFGVAVRFADTTPAADCRLFTHHDGSGADWRLVLETDGQIHFDNANGTALSSSSASPFTDNTWHYVDVYWTDSDTGSLEMWVDGTSVYTDASDDFNNGGSGNGRTVFGTATAGLCSDTSAKDYDDMYLIADPTGDAGDRLATASQFPEVFAYQCAQGSTCTQSGSALNSGGWDDTGDQPLSEAAVASYTGTPLAGDVDFDSGARAGPNGDARIDCASNIKGANWWFWMLRGGGGGTTHTLRWGNSSDAPTTAVFTPGTSFSASRKSGTGSEVPTNTEYCTMGMEVSGAQDLTAGEFFCYILHLPSAATDTTPTRKMRLFEGFSIKIREGGKIILYGL